MYAAYHNENPQVFAALLKGGAKIDDRDKYGRTPLLFATGFNPTLEIVKMLLKAGAGIDDQGPGESHRPDVGSVQ